MLRCVSIFRSKEEKVPTALPLLIRVSLNFPVAETASLYQTQRRKFASLLSGEKNKSSFKNVLFDKNKK
jgi:hypothetical protein